MATNAFKYFLTKATANLAKNKQIDPVLLVEMSLYFKSFDLNIKSFFFLHLKLCIMRIYMKSLTNKKNKHPIWKI